ncbi:Aste57867_10476 [Aphanomyces stellatus]|uniref:Aste57867_10476 protein n=1 Tax=Aphanomyces stellatus TaxID=120398 RepID=A0A485KRJ6_9STRA|nr:hypothetical protein As57867_010436 [Aphanomyces stellatus]VFT87350.1 Aste57867_10476 [Aphanomyces stellatus]
MMPRSLLSDVDGRYEHASMLLVDIAALSLSAGMCFATCFAVFKWSNVFRDAGHGTTFMFFFSLCLWSTVMLIDTIAVFLHDRLDTYEDSVIFYASVAAEALFNAISMWFSLAVFEFRRRVLHPPRSLLASRTLMQRYCIAVFGVALALMATLTILDLLDLKYHAPDGADDQLAAWDLGYISWGTWGIRLTALLYAIFVALSLRCCVRRPSPHLHLTLNHQTKPPVQVPLALVVIVALFVVLNLPYLIVAPLQAYRDEVKDSVLDSAWALSIMKALTFASGAATSVIMGASIAGFDAFYAPHNERAKEGAPTGLRPPSFFVLADSGSCSSN